MTIKDIARECGCAVGTVSRVLNNQDYVSESTRRKVQEVVDKYGFVLNKNARELKSRGSKTIVIIVKGVSSILLSEILEIIQKRMEKLPYVASVFVIDENDNETQAACNILSEQKPLGIIFLGGNPDRHREDFLRITIPCVLISTQSDDKTLPNLSSVSTDGFEASLEMAKFFIRRGHTKIGMIGGDLERSKLSLRRYQGFLEGLDENGIEFSAEKSYETAKYTLEDGAAAAERLVRKNPGLTGIFAMADVMALGACRRLRDLGFKVPDDISVAGFDGIPLADFYCPRISTIRQQTEAMAVQGLEILLGCIEKKSAAEHRLIPFEFFEGESVKKIGRL